MPINSTTRIETIVQVAGEASYAFSSQDTLAVCTAIPSGGTAVLLPAAPGAGDTYELADGDGSCSSGSPLTLQVTGAGQSIQGASSLALDTAFAWARVTFSAALRSWVVFLAGAGSTFERKPLPYTTIYVDPQDASGGASNANPGTNPSLPIATTAHLNVVNFFGVLTANTLIQYLSDDDSGTGVDISTMSLQAFTLTINQTRQTLHTGGTLDAGTIAIDPAANQAQVVHTSDLATFAPYVVTQLGGAAADGVRILDTTTGAGAFVMSAATAGAPQTTRPILADGTAGALTSGDPYTLTRGGHLTLAFQVPALGNPGVVVVNDCAFTAGSSGVPGAQYNRCTCAAPLSVGGQFSDCLLQVGIAEDGASTGAIDLLAGGLITTGADDWSGSFSLEGDVYVTGKGFALGGDFFSNVFFVPNSTIGAGVQFQDNEDNGIIIYATTSLVLHTGPTQPLFWGTGNVANGIAIVAGEAIVSQTVPPIVTGANAFAFIQPGGGYLTVGRAAVLGAYSEAGSAATRTTTWAHFAAGVGSGGFDFGAFCVEGGTALVGI